jgi:hypothetical protein
MKFIVSIIFSLFFFLGFSQNQNLPTNNTIIRLTILNEDGHILMRETNNGWMTPALYYKKRETINEAIQSMIKSYGIEILKPSFVGLFTYKYEFKSSSDIRLFYTAKKVKGKLKSYNKNEKLHWLSKKEAIEKLKTTVASLGEMTAQVLEHPETLWGGSFLLNKDENWKLSSKKIEEFYPIRDYTFTSLDTETTLVVKTLQNYMEGSSYNKLDILESAFTEDETLYLTGKDGFKIYTPKEYVGFFKNKKYGECNGRLAKVLAVEVIKDIASAKIEIVGPSRKWVYIDLFLLKKTDNGWKIISKTATRVDDEK